MPPNSNHISKHKWWKESTVYQIYPASFLSTGSGTIPGWGDIKGITSKLDYLKDLGVDVVWVSPIYKSPQIDMGYDISDYKDIDPRYGTLDDVDELIKGLNDRGMKLMMDLVVNHTSDQHEWFLNARSSKDSEKRDWYIWHPGRTDSSSGERKPPNNWSMILGEADSAWQWDEKTQQYYLGLFTREQPDLNWRTPAVREAVFDVQHFWLKRGISGFRMDVINLISKDPDFPDAEVIKPDVPHQPGHKHYANGPELHNYLQEMYSKVLSHYETITVGEMPFVNNPEEILKVVGAERGELNMIFIFELVDIDNADNDFRLSFQAFKVAEMRRIISGWQTYMKDNDGWNSIFIENHDNPRSVSRFCDDSTAQNRDLGAKLLALMQTTLSGTLYIYQGEELGQKNFPLSWPPEEYKDIETQNYWKKMQKLYEEGDKGALERARDVMQKKARDHSRTPVQWSGGANAEFCGKGTKPWMRFNDDYQSCNAETQLQEEGSVLQFWRRCLELRKKYKDVFIYGAFELLQEVGEESKIFAYKMSDDSREEAFVVVLNFSGEEVEFGLPKEMKVVEWVMGNHDSSQKTTEGKIGLRAWEGMVGRAKR